MFAPVTKLTLRLDPASADIVIRKALRTAVAERPGAVHLFAIARQAAPDDAIMTTDVGSHKLMAARVWPAARPRSVLLTNGLSAISP
jgi:thiamine pyrophosphate-dependent acetolactate synthase large subunit-like protein